MVIAQEPLASLSVEELARTCAEHSSRRVVVLPSLDPCYEIFRRALTPPPDDAAWSALVAQYQRLIRSWLGQYAGDDAVQDVLAHFWRAQQGACFSAQFSTTRAVLGYLKQCAITVRLDAWREEERRQQLLERLRDAKRFELVRVHDALDRRGDTDFYELLSSRLKGEAERVVFELSFYYNLAPREVQAERPDLFADVRAVHRVKENLLRRLARDPELERCWSDWPAEGGGKTTHSDV